MSPHAVNAEAALAYSVGDAPSEPFPHLWNTLVEHANNHGDRSAIVSLHSSKKPDTLDLPSREDDVRWTYSDLLTKATTLAESLSLSGVRKGATITAFLDNRAQWALLCWAAIRLDAVFVPVNPRMIGSPEEITYVLKVVEPTVLVVLDRDSAEELERKAAYPITEIPVRIIACPTRHSGSNLWTPLSSLTTRDVSPVNGYTDVQDNEVECPTFPLPSNDLDQQMMVLFTSGTTSLPKASVSNYMNFASAAMAWGASRQLQPQDVLVQHMPVFHAWSIAASLSFWLSGATVVFPSRSFDASATLAAIEREKGTHMLAVPSMIQGLISQLSQKPANIQSLRSIELAGTVVLPEIVEACIDKLGVLHTSVTYGMTEGSAVCRLHAHAMPYGRENVPDVLPCGFVTPGARLKVCKPGTRTILNRGDVGELHMGGLQVTKGYLDRASDDFYDEDGTNWLVTGDQAQIDSDGMVYVLGRYKDLIIRGGENLAPAIIERCLDAIAGIDHSQVVGIPDEVAGEIPVAIIQKSSKLALSKYQIQQMVAEELGRVCAPQHIFELQEDLSLADYPRTTSGKIKKRDLRVIITDFLAKQSAARESDEKTRSTVERLIAIWARVSGRTENEISQHERADTFADSITMMQFCNLVRKDLGKTITVNDLVGDIDILSQARIVDARPTEQEAPETLTRQGPPTAKDIIHTSNSERIFGNLRSRVETTLEPSGLKWADVEYISPTSQHVALMSRPFRLRGWNRRHAYHAPRASVEDLRWAVMSCLKVHPMFRSMIVDHGKDLPVHVVLRPNDSWFKLAISEGHEVDHAEDLSTFRMEDDDVDYASCPGPLFRIMLVHVRDTNSAGVIYPCHHGTFDAISFSMWNEDVDIALRTRNHPKPRTDFKSFVDRKYRYIDSRNSNAACDFHVRRLQGWSDHRNALWPPQRSPQFFRGRDTHWTHVDDTPGKPSERQMLDTHPRGIAGIKGSVTLPSLSSIKQSHGITAQIILKASLALLNIHYTNTDQAFFGQYEASRVWPTETGDPDPNLPNTMEIAGPTWEFLVNRIPIQRSQTLLHFLSALQEEQKQISRYAQVPFKKLESLLGDQEHELFDSVFRRQCFNWLPNTRPRYTDLVAVQSITRSDIGLQWDFTHVDGRTVSVKVVYDDCQLRAEEVEIAIEKIFACATWITDMVGGGLEECLVGECPLLVKEDAVEG